MQLRKFLFRFGPPAPVEALKMLKEDIDVAWSAFSPDGSRLAVAGDELSIWDLWNLRKILSVPLTRPSADCRLIAWSDANMLAVADEAGHRIQILDGAKGFAIAKVLEFDMAGSVIDFAFNASGSRLLVAHSGRETDDDAPNAAVFDTDTWDKISLRTGLWNSAVAWLGDDIVAAGHSMPNGLLSYVQFDPQEPVLPRPVRIVPAGATRLNLLVCPDRRIIILSSNGLDTPNTTRIRFIDPDTTTVSKVVDVPGTLGAGMKLFGSHLVLCLTTPQQRQLIRLLNVENGIFHNKTFTCRFTAGMAASPDGKQIAMTHHKNVFTYRLQEVQ